VCVNLVKTQRSNRRILGKMASLTTPFTTLLGIKHPIVLAGMVNVSGGELSAAVINAGGLSVIGGYKCTPDELRAIIEDMKSRLDSSFITAAATPSSSSSLTTVSAIITATSTKTTDTSRTPDVTARTTRERLPFGIEIALPKVGHGARRTVLAASSMS
jgi:NAD(P)H-dependent flavin oxidoreductase YrpB (nitropropane dioxygenase family)